LGVRACFWPCFWVVTQTGNAFVLLAFTASCEAGQTQKCDILGLATSGFGLQIDSIINGVSPGKRVPGEVDWVCEEGR